MFVYKSLQKNILKTLEIYTIIYIYKISSNSFKMLDNYRIFSNIYIIANNVNIRKCNYFLKFLKFTH